MIKKQSNRHIMLGLSAFHSKQIPIIIILVLVITGIITSFGLVYPSFLMEFSRNPIALSSGEWWNLITPLFLHEGGWSQIISNFIFVAFVGTLVEWIYGKYRWLIFYFVSGMVGEIFGHFWEPYGAGNSIAGAGLLGALLVWIIISGDSLPLQVRIWGPIGLLFGIVLIIFHNIHGPPIFIGAILASIILLNNNIKK